MTQLKLFTDLELEENEYDIAYRKYIKLSLKEAVKVLLPKILNDIDSEIQELLNRDMDRTAMLDAIGDILTKFVEGR